MVFILTTWFEVEIVGFFLSMWIRERERERERERSIMYTNYYQFHLCAYIVVANLQADRSSPANTGELIIIPTDYETHSNKTNCSSYVYLFPGTAGEREVAINWNGPTKCNYSHPEAVTNVAAIVLRGDNITLITVM